MSKAKGSECVRVVIRCRPLSDKEEAQGFKRIVNMDVKRGTVVVDNPRPTPGETPRTFTFDSVYNWNSKQRDLYDETFCDLVDSVLNGFNGTIFAYGQTGTGKTHTMQGVKTDPELRGVIPNSFEQIFNHIGRSTNQQYLVRASYLEIYQEEIRDLLSKNLTKRLELKERPDTGVYVKDLSSFVTKSIKEIEHVMNVGNQNRSVGATNMNEHSSRSHAIFLVTIECGQVSEDGESHIRVGKLNMVDLAGSERQAKTGSTGERLKEATKINLSLSALGNVISALVDGKSTHIPYRDSKLTRLLQDSLGGNAKTVMVANIGPADYNYDETLNTLRYANRAKNIKNKPRINEDPKDALLREFQEEIARLRSQLEGKGGPRKKKSKKKKRRVRVNENGEEVEDWESEEEDDDEANVAQYMQEQQQKLEQEKEAILNNKHLLAEERDRLIQQKEEQEARLEKEREAKEAVANKIKAMQSKLLVGGKNIVDHTNEQERMLENKRQEILRKEREERELQQRLEQKEESALNLQETFSSLQQEVEIKTKKLKKLFAKLQAIKQEMADMQEEHIRERQELEKTQEELTRDLKLKLLIVGNFVPPEEKTKIVGRAVFDEDEDMWKVTPIARNEGSVQMSKRPVSACGNRRPVSEYAKMAAAMGGNPRYRGENIINIELDLPSRTTRDYEGPDIAPGIADALNTALREEEDLLIDGSPAVFSNKARPRSSKKKSQLLKKNRTPDDEVFPSSRGLVPK